MKQKKLCPAGNRLLVEIIKPEEPKKGSLFLTVSNNKPVSQERAKIIAEGTGHQIPGMFKVGTIVLINKYDAREVIIDEKEFYIIDADKIIAFEADEED